MSFVLFFSIRYIYQTADDDKRMTNTALNFMALVVVVKVMMMIVINGGWDKKLQHPNKVGGSGLIVVVT